MDPFNQVHTDATEELATLKEFLRNNPSPSAIQCSEFESQLADLKDTIDDLKETVQNIEKEPELYTEITKNELIRRNRLIQALEQNFKQISASWAEKKPVKSGTSENPFASYEDEIDHSVDTKIAESRNLQLQQELRYQDEQIDGVFDSVQRINEQARLMGTELDEQAVMIEDFERDMSRTQGRVNRSMKRLNGILQKNKERMSDCCIALLIGVLLVLLILIAIL